MRSAFDAALRKGIKTVALAGGPFTRARPGDVSILAYHRVGVGDDEITMPTALLEGQLAWLSAEGRAADLDAALSRETGAIVLTFDDGYRDFHDVVVPLLLRYRLPALLYLATGLVSDREPDRLRWNDLRDALATGLVEIGSHTHGHVNLARAGEREAAEEMRRSKESIEDELGVPCRHFAYPWAVGSPAADRVARRLFVSAALGAWRVNRRGSFDLHRLARIPALRSDGSFFFRAKARGLLDAEGLAYRVLKRGPWGPPTVTDRVEAAP
jgi:peptidoglycan/xylan/chitin deacetylase (PgdA/CDA1 family)